MIDAAKSGRPPAKLLAVSADGQMQHMPRVELAWLFERGDLVVANDAATLPASLRGKHCRTGEAIEIRLAGWVSVGDPTRFVAVAFGTGDHRTRTERRALPPPFSAGDRLQLGPVAAVIERLLGHPRLLALHLEGDNRSILEGLARHGRPIQYAHVPEPLSLWDVWTRIATDPVAFEPPSAGFALDWGMIANWQRRGIRFATLTHAAGISSTGDPLLDARFPLDEPYRVPKKTAEAIEEAQSGGSRIIAIGTTVVRAIESAAKGTGRDLAGDGIARGRIVRGTQLRAVDSILTGVHQPGESHFELLRAFADDATLDRVSCALAEGGYRSHEFGDSLLIERAPSRNALAKLPQMA